MVSQRRTRTTEQKALRSLNTRIASEFNNCKDEQNRWTKGLAIRGSTNVNRLFYFPVFAFLSLFALLLLFSEEFSRFSAPHSTLESGKAIDGATVEKATSINPHAVTERDLQPDLLPISIESRRRWSGVGRFRDPAELKVSANDQGVDSPVDAALNKVTPKSRGTLSRPKDHARQQHSVKSVSRYRPAANLLARIRCWLVGEFGLAHMNGRPWKETRINGRSTKKRLMTRVRSSRDIAQVSQASCRFSQSQP